MRNLYADPVKKAEVLLAIHEAMQEANDEAVGNISPYALKKAYLFIERHANDVDFMEEFLPG